jgi:hypothetical protein
MANESNLIPLNVRTKEEQRRIAAEGGKASVKARRDKKMLKDCLEALLERAEKVEIDGKTLKLTGAELIALTAYQKAASGDIKAMEFVRDTAGQKPVEKVMIAEVEQSVVDEVEAMVMQDDEG